MLQFTKYFSKYSRKSSVSLPKYKMKVYSIPILSDNYSYLLVDEASKEAAIVDPAEPGKVLDFIKSKDVKLTSLLCTHHHLDHSGGNSDVIAAFPGLVVYGGDDRIPGLTQMVKDKEDFKANINVDN